MKDFAWLLFNIICMLIGGPIIVVLFMVIVLFVIVTMPIWIPLGIIVYKIAEYCCWL